MSTVQWTATGRRKSAVARVFLRPGTGVITINHEGVDEYFHRDVLCMVLKQPLELTNHADTFDVMVNVVGAGKAGQAGAVLHGIARALLEYNADLRPVLKSAGFLTRDARAKERKKYGQKGARARFQFSKR